MNILIALCLLCVVLSAWVAAAVLLRLRQAADRLHAVSFIALACYPLLLIIALLDKGATPMAGKLLVMLLGNVLVSAALAHVVGRLLAPPVGDAK